MKLAEICPFVRFAMDNIHPKIDFDITTKDNRLFFVTNGTAVLKVDNEIYNIKKNTVLLWQNGTVYRFFTSQDFSAISINFDYTYENSDLVNYFPFIPSHENFKANKLFFEDFICLNSPIIINNAHSVLPKLEKIVENFATKLPLSPVRVSSLLKSIIADIVHLSLTKPISNSADQKIDKIITYIKQNYNEKITNQDIAKLVGYHPYYLNRIMKNVIGTSIHQFLLDFRLSQAEKLLISTQKSVAEIAFEVGFSSSVSFINNFKNKNNLTPNEFRKNMMNLF